MLSVDAASRRALSRWIIQKLRRSPYRPKGGRQRCRVPQQKTCQRAETLRNPQVRGLSPTSLVTPRDLQRTPVQKPQCRDAVSANRRHLPVGLSLQARFPADETDRYAMS